MKTDKDYLRQLGDILGDGVRKKGILQHNHYQIFALKSEFVEKNGIIESRIKIKSEKNPELATL